MAIDIMQINIIVPISLGFCTKLRTEHSLLSPFPTVQIECFMFPHLHVLI